MNGLWLLPLFIFALTAPLSVAMGNIATGLIVAAAVGITIRSPREIIQWVPRRVLMALASVLVWNAVSTFAADPGTSDWGKLGEEWWMKLLILAVPILLTGSTRNLRRVLFVILGSGTFVAIYGIVQHFTGWDFVRHKALLSTGGNFLSVGFTGHHLSFGGQLMVLMPMALALLLAALKIHNHRLWIQVIVPLLMGIALVWTYARSSLLGVAAAALFLVLVQKGRIQKWGLGAVLLVLVGMAAMPSVRVRMLDTFTNPKEVTRLNLWRSSISGIEAKPVTGWGPGNFDRMLTEHEYPGYYEARGHAHNDLLMQAVNAGVPGVLVFLWLYGEIFYLLWRGWRLEASDRGVLTGAMACQVAVLVGGIFQVYQTDDEPEMLLYFLLGCGLAAAMQALNAKARFENSGKQRS